MTMSIFVNKEQITQVIEELQYFKSLFIVLNQICVSEKNVTKLLLTKTIQVRQ